MFPSRIGDARGLRCHSLPSWTRSPVSGPPMGRERTGPAPQSRLADRKGCRRAGRRQAPRAVVARRGATGDCHSLRAAHEVSPVPGVRAAVLGGGPRGSGERGQKFQVTERFVLGGRRRGMARIPVPPTGPPCLGDRRRSVQCPPPSRFGRRAALSECRRPGGSDGTAGLGLPNRHFDGRAQLRHQPAQDGAGSGAGRSRWSRSAA